MPTTLYDILGISSKATNEEIKQAYKALAKKHHPDKNPGDNWHEEQFKRVNQAYQILSNSSKRILYDGRLEYEAYLRQNPRPVNNTPPATTRVYKGTQKKNNPDQTESKEKFYYLTFSNTKINLYVVCYYVVAITLLGMFYEYQDYLKVQYLVLEAQQHEKEGQFDYAITSYSRAISLDKDFSEAYEKRGILKLKFNNDLYGALIDFSKAIELEGSPEDSLTFKRGKCLFYLREYQQAILDFNTIISKPEATIDSAFYFKAESNFNLDNLNIAIPDYTKFITLAPGSGEAHWKRGICYYRTKNYGKALPDYNFTIGWQPENGENYYYRGIINFALKDSVNGCKDLHDSFLLGYTESLNAKNKYCGSYITENYDQ
jgi:curved DNA-binding protein CbpA